MVLDYVLLLRWLHILSAIAIVGGTMFQLIALTGPLATLPEATRSALSAAICRRWSKVVMLAILLLLGTGLFNWIHTGTAFQQAFERDHPNLNLPIKEYRVLLTIKACIALVIFFIASALSGRGSWTNRFRAKAALWLSINLLLCVVVVGISGVVRSMHTGPNIPRVQEDLARDSNAPAFAPPPVRTR